MAAVFVGQQIHIRAYVLWYKKGVKFINWYKKKTKIYN